MIWVRLEASISLSKTIALKTMLLKMSSVAICHPEAVCLSPTSGSEKGELVSVGERLMPVAPLTGELLLGVAGNCIAVVVKEVSVLQLDHLP